MHGTRVISLPALLRSSECQSVGYDKLFCWHISSFAVLSLQWLIFRFSHLLFFELSCQNTINKSFLVFFITFWPFFSIFGIFFFLKQSYQIKLIDKIFSHISVLYFSSLFFSSFSLFFYSSHCFLFINLISFCHSFCLLCFQKYHISIHHLNSVDICFHTFHLKILFKNNYASYYFTISRQKLQFLRKAARKSSRISWSGLTIYSVLLLFYLADLWICSLN